MIGASPSAERRGPAFSVLCQVRTQQGSSMHTRGRPQQTPPAPHLRPAGPGRCPWVSPSLCCCCCTARAVRHVTRVRSDPDSPVQLEVCRPVLRPPMLLSLVWLVLFSWVSSLPPAPGARCICVGPTWCRPPGFSAQDSHGYFVPSLNFWALGSDLYPPGPRWPPGTLRSLSPTLTGLTGRRLVPPVPSGSVSTGHFISSLRDQ